MTPERPFVAYYRVSTDKQGRSGLGLEAQIAAVQQHTKRSGGEIAAAFQEIETGKHSDRPQLQAALKVCRQKKAVLVIAKLDRLSRDPDFIGSLLKAEIDFVACDMPTANKLTIRIMAAIAEHEREAISQRTKDALKAAKARGQKLGNPRPDTATMSRHRAGNARQFREGVYPLIRQLRDEGKTFRAIADHLNERGIRSQNNRQWHLEAVRLVLLRHDELAYKSNITAQDAA